VLIVKNQSSQTYLWSASPAFRRQITLKITSLSIHGLEQILHRCKLLQLHGAIQMDTNRGCGLPEQYIF